MLSPFECLCGNFILPEPASYVFFYAIFNLRKLLYLILWYGNVTPGERGVEKDGRLWNLGRLILQNEEELAPLLSEKAKEVLEKLRDNQSELNNLNECEVFVCGFRLGARIMLEVLDGSDKWGEFEE